MEFPKSCWKYKNPSDVGLTDKLLDDLDDYIGKNQIKMKSLIIIKDGYIVFEEYFNGGYSSKLYRQFSVTKSINSLAMGILIDKGIIGSEDDLIVKYLPEYGEYGKLQESLKIKDLLHMSSGMYSKSNLAELFGKITARMEEASVSIATTIMNSGVPLDKLLALPVNEVDYGSYCYNTASSYFLVEIMKKALSEPYSKFIEKNLFKPMGITNYTWDKEANHEGYLISLTTLDLARFGLLMLNSGNWNGVQVVSKEWIRKSLDPGVVDFYGYQWWMDPGSSVFWGSGYGGQGLISMPDNNIIIAGNCSVKGKGSGLTPFQVYFDFLSKRI